MKDHLKLNSKQNILRQAILDLAVSDYAHTLQEVVGWQLHHGYSIDRLCKFSERRLGITYDQAATVVAYLCPEKLN